MAHVIYSLEFQESIFNSNKIWKIETTGHVHYGFLASNPLAQFSRQIVVQIIGMASPKG
jgi:hypothetical protein